MFNKTVYFNNFDISTLTGIKVLDYNITDLPLRNMNLSKLARSNTSVLTSAEYAQKLVTVSGVAGGADWQEQMDNLDALKARVQGLEVVIRFDQGTKEVEYCGTLSMLNKDFKGPTLGWTLGFTCANPIGVEAGASTLLPSTNVTANTVSTSITVDGSFTAKPRITVDVTSVTGGTDKSISIVNAGTGKGIKITRDWSNGDVLSIASDLLEVTVNLVGVDFTGTFPEFTPGSRTIQYIDDFSSRDVDVSATYNKAYS